MELPKNITQIGESDPHCKVYVEDYVISFLKQVNALATDKAMAVALYGVRKEENHITYLFLYGACKVDFLQKESKHLSDAQQQAIEQNRKKYFPEYSFLAYQVLQGEMVEGFWIWENGISRYITGYAQFYEKNDSMLAYLLEIRKEATPEVVEQDKYNVVRGRQEEKKILAKESYKKASGERAASGFKGQKGMVAVLALFCMIGLAAGNGQLNLQLLQNRLQQKLKALTTEQIADVIEVGSRATNVDTLVAEDKLADVLLQENEKASVEPTDLPPSDAGQTSDPENLPPSDAGWASDTENLPQPDPGQADGTENLEQPADLPQPDLGQESATENPPQPDVDQTINEEDRNADPVQETPTPNVSEENDVKAYTILPGDTLLGISVKTYGNGKRVEEICQMNRITDPDEIQIGEKILLP